jgi:hypothetical protein
MRVTKLKSGTALGRSGVVVDKSIKNDYGK